MLKNYKVQDKGKDHVWQSEISKIARIAFEWIIMPCGFSHLTRVPVFTTCPYQQACCKILVI
jgi:hypothetical protein